MTYETPRWYIAMDKRTGRTFYVRKGFGADGELLAVYDYQRYPMAVGARMTAAGARQRFNLGGVAPNQTEIENRFTWELHR